MKQPVTTPNFRKAYQELLDEKRSNYSIKLDSEDDWVIISRKSFTDVKVYHQLPHSLLKLALSRSSFDIVGTAVPPGCKDVSTEKTRLFQWNVPPVNGTVHPQGQRGATIAIEFAKWAFEWVEENRVQK
ncbi:hypothetical protein [Limimaricola cinnabarinus]|uniref:hypothetical protein n=1 Tax=Limimaricola cinnabarinus TaxID=1125964 RepID=UPI002FE1A8EB